jgi:hypothetical protein
VQVIEREHRRAVCLVDQTDPVQAYLRTHRGQAAQKPAKAERKVGSDRINEINVV